MAIQVCFSSLCMCFKVACHSHSHFLILKCLHYYMLFTIDVSVAYSNTAFNGKRKKTKPYQQYGKNSLVLIEQIPFELN